MSYEHDINMEACNKLASAAIMLAAKDYYTAKRNLAFGKDKAAGIGSCANTLKKCTEFFRSKRYMIYANISEDSKLAGERLMAELDQMVEDTMNIPLHKNNPFRFYHDSSYEIDREFWEEYVYMNTRIPDILEKINYEIQLDEDEIDIYQKVFHKKYLLK